MKKMQITFPNTEIWEIPVNVIAENRANYYAEFDGFKKGSLEWQNEVDEFIDDEFELIDWATNNMLWESELHPYASRVESFDDYDYELNLSDAKWQLEK